ncbi:multicopper oxidase family protein [Streptomyces sp. ALI-76-A]|uniref:multicopper oxidase family protein n=1 Tax=Streptomyces sp. ALI-76-A TaxID=3025736 RepID=UPI00256F5EB6|nr:multicopper oxidase family protein [Streptomyces sp. ALI-76-A]MDL5201248.1 multicopper oxidase family protein [Streptomyces sp. ALI-76-A]
MTMRPSRRALLKAATATGLTAAGLGAAGCGTMTREVSGEQLTSRARLPAPFRVPLPVPVTATATRRRDGGDHYELVQRAARVEILPGLRTEVWGYDGRFPGTTLVGRSGRTTTVRVRNELPVPTSTHLHGGVQAPESDGSPLDLVVPPGYAGPGSPAGHGHSGHGAHAGHMRTRPGDWTFSPGAKTYTYPLRQPAATLWYHDHRMDFSAPQVWRGLAGMFLVHDDVEDALPLPRGERDIPLMICDRAFEEDGALLYPSLDPSLTGEPGVEDAYMEGVTGDVLLVNGAPWPELEVSATRHRFRIVNASNARRYRLELEPGPREGAGFVQVGSDAGLLERPVRHDVLPVAPGERFDVVVDFAAYPVGSTVTLVNTLGTGGTRSVMRFRIVRRERETSRVPERLAGVEPAAAGRPVAERRFDFRLTSGSGGELWTINGRAFDSARVLARPRLGTVERWRFSSDFHHPVHLHLAHFLVVARGGRTPLPSDAGWKDTVDVRPYEVVDVLVRFRGHRGRYMVHCHNLEHEDMAMMANFEVV